MRSRESLGELVRIASDVRSVVCESTSIVAEVERFLLHLFIPPILNVTTFFNALVRFLLLFFKLMLQRLWLHQLWFHQPRLHP
mmetsp:Transcript_11683/g.17726  ORF Transcript_11683/g.17726 Transcript_11683/m.17726 type:complete len:83 (+) Transcript_11683:174-422(+)